ncbi:DNA primase [Rubrobacter indicoceani]|uniref:DNA primase n=1 Tax=Rubrobacter indicoceani TaxID=2051957 RepID=UPI0013C4204D|nr:DNA primase [Rubrobacter indicoceani]
MRISQSSIERVKETADIIEVASEFTALRRQGQRFVGLCPYPDHDEKSPSFGVTPEQGFYYCFGCQRGGDAIKLVSDLKDLPFSEAVTYLAERSNIELEFEGSRSDAEAAKKRQSRRKAVLRALSLAAAYYHKTLTASDSPHAEEARKYLKSRGFTHSTIEEFRLGYAMPRGRGALMRAAGRYDIGRGDLDAAGLLSSGGGERFAGRVMFPISDRRGKIVGFGGRAMGDDGPKYLNSPETEVFDKRNLLYGFPQVTEHIRRESAAILVEGYTDVLMMYQAGIKNAAATLGTAATPAHLKILGRYFGRHTDRVYAIFDPDDAGNRAASRLADPEALSRDPGSSLPAAAAQLQIDLRMVPLTKDPADWLKEHSEADFREQLDRSVPIVEYLLQTALAGQSGGSAASKSRLLPWAKSLVQSMDDPVMRNDAARVASEHLGVRVEELLPPRADRRSGGRDASNSLGGGEKPRTSPFDQAGLDVLAFILAAPDSAAELIEGGVELEPEAPETLVLMPQDFATSGQGQLFALLARHVHEELRTLPADGEARPFMDHIGRLSSRGENLFKDEASMRAAWLRLAILSRQNRMRTTRDFDLKEQLHLEVLRLKGAINTSAPS